MPSQDQGNGVRCTPYETIRSESILEAALSRCGAEASKVSEKKRY